MNSHPGMIFDLRMVLPNSVSSGQLERTYAFGFLRLMLPAVLNLYGHNPALAENVSLPGVGSHRNHILALTHNGKNVGALSIFTLLPDTDSTIIVLGNTTALGDATGLIAQLLTREVLGSSDSQNFIASAENIARECSGWFERTLESPLAAQRT